MLQQFTVQLSLDLAGDEELIQLLLEACFISVMIGIKSPNEASLRETGKFQNLRKGGSIIEKIHRIQDSEYRLGSLGLNDRWFRS